MYDLRTVIGRRQLSELELELKHNVEFLQDQLENYIQESLDEVLLGCVLEVEIVLKIIEARYSFYNEETYPAKFFVLNDDIMDVYIDFGVRTKNIVCVVGVGKVSQAEYVLPLSAKAQHKAIKVLTTFLKNNDRCPDRD